MAFCRRVQPRLVSVLALHAGSLPDAEEIAQEALVRAWQRWSTVSTMASPEGWVYRVALNLSTSRLRRRRVERRADEAPAAVHPQDVSAVEGIMLRRALATLPVRQRTVLVLRFLADFSVVETAAIMSCAPGTVKALTSQGLAGLRSGGLVTGSGASEEEEVRDG